jgi:hypothetical protein
MHDGVYLQLWPDWSPSIVPELARFPGLLKVAAGASLPSPAALEIRLLDEAGRLLRVEPTSLDLGADPLLGPAWQKVGGRLVQLDERVAHAEGALDGTVSDRVGRDEAALTVQLKPVGGELGLAGEPHLWWCFRNRTDAPVDVGSVLNETVVWVDGRPLPRPPAPYDGPANLPPHKSLSAWWSLDHFGLTDRATPREFALEILGERSRPFVAGWSP